MRFFLLLVMVTTASCSTGEPPALSADIRAALEQAIERNEIRAAVAGVYTDGEVRVVSLGRIGREDERAPDGDTAFEIGSISKVFTALLTQVQASAGRLTWDDPISRHLPEVQFKSEAVAAITLRELASHTSGLPRIPDNMSFDDPLDPYAGYEREDLLAFVAGFAPESLDKSYDYSNLGAGLLGLIAGDVAGPGYATAMSRDVLEPLGMHETAVGLANDDAVLARGFSQGADMPNWSGFDALAGAGALVSTTGDLLHFLEQNLTGGDLSQALAAIRESQAAGDTALGWHRHEVSEEDVVYWHNGGTGGYASYLAMRPATRSGFVLLTTSTAYALVTELGMAQITGQSLSGGDVDLEPYPGSYRLADGFVLSVFIEDGRLFGQATGQGPFPMTFEGRDEFVFPPAGIRIVFERGESGRAEKLTMHQGGQVTEAPRVAATEGPQVREAIDIGPARLGEYTGRYQLAPGATFNIEARDGQLYAQLTGQPAYPVFPYEEDRFFYRVVDAQLHFERDDDGTVTAVVLHQAGERRAPKLE